MLNRVLLFLLLLSVLTQEAAGAVVRIADGDCASLSAAAASAPGSEPSLIVLANRGNYGACVLSVSGDIRIDGAGATLALASFPSTSLSNQIQVMQGGDLTLRNANLGNVASLPGAPARASMVAESPASPAVFVVTNPVISNKGTLTLESVSLSGMSDWGSYVPPMIANSGELVLRNVSIVNNVRSSPIISNGGSVEISHSTFAQNQSSAGLLSNSGTISVANSLFTNAGATCAPGTADTPQNRVISLGGNISTDDSCALRLANDRVVGDAGLGAFGDNGGLVNTVPVSASSVAVRNGIAANCEASDARGVVRNVQARGGCDSGAYEFGGGRGLLSQGGMSGFFYDAQADGHYVTVQRLDWGSALVIWNTFDRNGQAAWIYAIGEVSGNHVHAQGAQNLGGVLQPGGAPTGSHGVVWGDIDIDLQNCFGGTFSYNSPLPNFGSGQFPLNRLAFLGDLDCSN